MAINKTARLAAKIEQIKNEIHHYGDMRPGSVTKQLHRRGQKSWPYWQISYTLKRRSRTEYVRDEFVEQIQAEVLAYKRFKLAIDKLVELNIQLSKEKIKETLKKLKNK